MTWLTKRGGGVLKTLGSHILFLLIFPGWLAFEPIKKEKYDEPQSYPPA